MPFRFARVDPPRRGALSRNSSYIGQLVWTQQRNRGLANKIPKMPVEIIAHNPRVLALPAAGFGILMRLTLHYWMTECRALPKKGDDLFSVGRAQRPTWARWQAEIMGIFAEIQPELERSYRLQADNRKAVFKLAMRGGSARALRLREAAQAERAPVDQAPTQVRKHEPNRKRDATPAGEFFEHAA